MTLNEYREINWRCWCVKGRLTPLSWTESALWDAHSDYGARMWSNEEATYTASNRFEQAFIERVLSVPGLHSYVNSPQSHIAIFFRYYQPNSHLYLQTS